MGGARGLGYPSSVYSPTKSQGAEGEGRIMYPQTLKIVSLNMCECSMLDGKLEVMERIFVELMFDVLVLSETKLKGKDECEFGYVSGRMSDVTQGRARGRLYIVMP